MEFLVFNIFLKIYVKLDLPANAVLCKWTAYYRARQDAAVAWGQTGLNCQQGDSVPLQTFYTLLSHAHQTTKSSARTIREEKTTSHIGSGLWEVQL